QPRMLRAALRRGAFHADPANADGPGRLDLEGLLDALDPTATSAPELVVEDFVVSPRTLAPGAPIHAQVRIRNVGPVAAFGVDVVLREADGVVLDRWPIRSLAPGAFRDLETYALVPRRGPRTFEIEVNPDEPGVLPEFYRGNNVVPRTIEGVYETRFLSTTIVSDPAIQANPDIGHRNVVWEDYRWGLPQIASYELASGLESRRTFDGEYHVAPAIAAGRVAWQDLRSNAGSTPGTWDVRFQNLLNGQETDATDGLAAEIEVAAHREWLVWTDSRNGLGNADIYAYRWIDGTEVRVTEDDSQQETPSTWRHRVVWEDFRSGIGQIRMRNLATEDERAITDEPWSHKSPQIWRRNIVYEDFRDGNWDIVIRDVISGAGERVTSDPFDQFNPDVSERYVVWQDSREIDWDVWCYDRASGDRRKITADRVDQRRPRIYGHRVVFGTFESGDEDIGMIEIEAFPSAPHGLALTDLGSGVRLDWSPPQGISPDRYRIYRARLDRTRWTLLGETTTTSYVDETGDPGTYRWAISALDGANGEGPAATIESP
ncbi:MAG: hypothetical protein OER88_11765, partial [Planctomycetota bacterium]|nr:hypothetical protein [Planctomycetota bacterium]